MAYLTVLCSALWGLLSSIFHWIWSTPQTLSCSHIQVMGLIWVILHQSFSIMIGNLQMKALFFSAWINIIRKKKNNNNPDWQFSLTFKKYLCGVLSLLLIFTKLSFGGKALVCQSLSTWASLVLFALAALFCQASVVSQTRPPETKQFFFPRLISGDWILNRLSKTKHQVLNCLMVLWWDIFPDDYSTSFKPFLLHILLHIKRNKQKILTFM